jgi:hypothetical protein
MELRERTRKEKRDAVWNAILVQIFTSTYSSALSNEEILCRIDFIIQNLTNINPINLFKCILYSDTTNEVGKLAIDYRLKFILDDYETTIRNGESYEIDNIEFHEKDKLNKEIHELCLALNVLINSKIMGNTQMDIRTCIDHLGDVISVKHRDIVNPTWNLHGGIQHIQSINQIVYCAVFNQNPHDGEIVNQKYRDYIYKHFETRCRLFEKLKEKYHTGIKLSHVQNRSLFG